MHVVRIRTVRCSETGRHARCATQHVEINARRDATRRDANKPFRGFTEKSRSSRSEKRRDRVGIKADRCNERLHFFYKIYKKIRNLSQDQKNSSNNLSLKRFFDTLFDVPKFFDCYINQQHFISNFISIFTTYTNLTLVYS